jgi:hypothetical protein
MRFDTKREVFETE